MYCRKILGIVFVIVALVCIHGFSRTMFREDGHTTKTMEKIEKAVFLQNGKVDNENEGKPVIVRGKLHTAKETHDTQLCLTIHSPYVERKMEILGNNGKWKEDEGGSAAFFGKATLGEFKLSKDFLKDIKLTKGYAKFSESELVDLAMKDEYVYVSDTRRYLYSYVPDRKELTLVGIQNGKTLEEIRGTECVREGNLSKADLKRDEDELNIPYLIGWAVLSVFFIVLACWMLGLFSKRRTEEDVLIKKKWPAKEKESIDLCLDEKMSEKLEAKIELKQESINSLQNIKLMDDLKAFRVEQEDYRQKYIREQEAKVIEKKREFVKVDGLSEHSVEDKAEKNKGEVTEKTGNQKENDLKAELKDNLKVEMLVALQNNWVVKQQKKKTFQVGSMKQRSRKRLQSQYGEFVKKKQVKRKR